MVLDFWRHHRSDVLRESNRRRCGSVALIVRDDLDPISNQIVIMSKELAGILKSWEVKFKKSQASAKEKGGHHFHNNSLTA
ncbi:hypothetical protein Hdeb2414_s0007g00261851 [Helianthus debilis subsp. tardiflorus]